MNPYLTAQRQFLRELQNGVDVTLRWKTVPNGTVHPTTGALLGTPVSVAETIKGIFHPMDPKTQIHHFNVVTDGVAYLDLAPDTTIAGREGLVFEIDGRPWVQDKEGEKVVEHYDVFHQGTRYCRTILIRRQT